MSVRCSDLSLALDEPMTATAPHALGWVLVEQKGAWGAKALTESGLDPEIGRELERRAKELGLKALLLKPPGRDPSRGRSVFLVSSVPGSSFVEEVELGDPAALVDVDLAPLARGAPTGVGRIATTPLYLVCTNGRRDACCARLGRAVAKTLAAARPGRVWECSHLGGHRFAANVVCLPEGIVYGRVSADRAPEVARTHEQGQLVLDLLRGRSSLPPEAQAADALLRARGGLTRIGALVLQRAEGNDVSFRDENGGLQAVRIVKHEAGPPRAVSCGDDEGRAGGRVVARRLSERALRRRIDPDHDVRRVRRRRGGLTVSDCGYPVAQTARMNPWLLWRAS